jgi:hypothetical protein
MGEYLLTFVLSAEGDSLDMHGNSAGLKWLSQALDWLVSRKESEHYHLMTPEGGRRWALI